jgi:hypothetical protein
VTGGERNAPQSVFGPDAGRLLRARRGLLVALIAPMLAAGCGSPGKCPKPVAYDEATLREIQKALTALPKDSVLRQVMADYETERDDLRFCK